MAKDKIEQDKAMNYPAAPQAGSTLRSDKLRGIRPIFVMPDLIRHPVFFFLDSGFSTLRSVATAEDGRRNDGTAAPQAGLCASGAIYASLRQAAGNEPAANSRFFGHAPVPPRILY